ncbi:MAG: MFS transporter [archaeon]
MAGKRFQRQEPEYRKVKRSLRLSILDGSFFNIMDGFTASFITPFALFLKSSNLIISLLSSLPELSGAFFQLLSVKANEFFKSRKILISFVYFIQAILWLPLLLIPKFASEGASGSFMLLFMTLIAMFGAFGGPLWRGMMGDLVSEHERGGFFSKRNKIIAVVCFLATFVAGFILQHYAITNVFKGFVILFVVAFIARSFSAFFIFLMYEKKSYGANRFIKKNDSLTLTKFLRGLTKSDFGIFVLFICIFRISVSVASPFFAVYELKFLGFSYLQFTLLSAVEILASFLFLGIWGKVNDEMGSKRVILITGLLIPLVPLLYLFSANYYYLMAVTVLSGAVWGGFNLSVGNFLFDASDSANRVRYVSYFNLIHGIAIFVGAMAGGLLLGVLPATKESIKVLFLISGILRLIVALFLFPLMREMRIVQVSFDKRFFNYSVFIKPRQGFVQDPFDYYMAYEKRPPGPRPRLIVDRQLLDDSQYKDKFEEDVKEHAKYKNFIQALVDNMKKKK